MELYLVRHGETESNREKRYQGWTESPLSGQGLKQAEMAGHYLTGLGIEQLFCSDLQRARNTARVIGASCGIRPLVTPLLREINFGRWEGLTYDEIEATWGVEINRWLEDPFARPAPGGETLVRVRDRMLSFLKELVSGEGRQRKIAAVSHGGSIRVLLHHLMGLDRRSLWNLKVDNASVSLVCQNNNRLEVAYCNRTLHLEAGKREIGNSGD